MIQYANRNKDRYAMVQKKRSEQPGLRVTTENIYKKSWITSNNLSKNILKELDMGFDLKMQDI